MRDMGRKRGRMKKEEQDAYTDFLNGIERVAEKHGWNIGISDNHSEDKTFPRVEITFVPAGGADALNRKFGASEGRRA